MSNSSILLVEITAVEGGNISFSCSAAGLPQPDVMWSQTGTGNFSLVENVTEFDPALSILGETDSQLGVVTSVLTILNAQFPAHNGSYTCTGSNVNPKTMALHYNSSTVDVTILGKLCSVPEIITADVSIRRLIN